MMDSHRRKNSAKQADFCYSIQSLFLYKNCIFQLFAFQTENTLYPVTIKIYMLASGFSWVMSAPLSPPALRADITHENFKNNFKMLID